MDCNELEPREAWLEVALGHLKANADNLRPGVLSMSWRLLRGLECGPIPYPYIFVTGDKCYAIQWENHAGQRLSITVVGESIWRYTVRKGSKSSGRQTVRRDHVNRIRNAVEKLFPAINSGNYISMGFGVKGWER